MGGCEQVIQSIARSTQNNGYEHSLLSVCPKNTLQIHKFDDIAVRSYPQTVNISSCPMSLSLSKNFKEEIQNADILHYHFPWPFADLLHVTLGIKKPSLVTYHSDIVKQKFLNMFYAPLRDKFLSQVDAIVPTSENLLNSSKVLQKYKEKCFPIPIGIDEKDYFPIKSELALEYEKQFGKKFILFVGALRYYKGLHILLEAVVNTNVKVVIAGTGPMGKNLKEQAKRLNLQNVHFLNFISDEEKSALLSVCRAVVLPSHLPSEAFGVALVEGLIFGKPLISTELGTGTSFVNLNYQTGFVVKPSHVVELQNALTLLCTDDVLSEKMGIEARKHYEKYFTAEKMSSSYSELYQKLLV